MGKPWQELFVLRFKKDSNCEVFCMKILYENEIDNATLTPSSEDGAFPVANIKRIASTDEFRSASGVTGGSVLVDLGSAKECDFLAITGNTYTRKLAGDTITVTAGDDPSTTVMGLTQPVEIFNTTLSTACYQSSVFVDLTPTSVIQFYINTYVGNRGEYRFLSKLNGVLTPIEQSKTVTPKSVQSFLSSNFSSLSIVALSATKIVACFADEANGQRGTALVVNISGDTITPAATPFVFNAGAVSHVSVDFMTSTQALVCYSDASDGNKGKAVVLTISTDTITAGAVFEFSSYAISIATVGRFSNSAVVNYRDSAGNGKSILFSISGTTITTSKTTTFSSSSDVSHICGTMIDNSRVAVFFRDGADGNKGKVTVLNLQGSLFEPLAGSPILVSDNSVSLPSARRLSDLNALIVYKDDVSGTAKAFVLNRTTGNVISKGQTKELSSDVITALHMSVINQFESVVTLATSTHGKAIGVRTTGDVVTCGTAQNVQTGTLSVLQTTKQDVGGYTNSGGSGILLFFRESSTGKACRIAFDEHIFETGSAANLGACKFDSAHALVCYRAASLSTGVAKVITVSPTVSISAGVTFETSYPQNIFVESASASSALAVYFYNATNGRAVAFSYTGGVLTAGTPVTFHSGIALETAGLFPLSNGSFFVVSNAASGAARACVLGVSGTVVTANTQYQIWGNSTRVITRKIDDTRALVAMLYWDGAWRFSTLIVGISGTVCTIPPSFTIILAGYVQYFSFAAFQSNVLLSYSDTVSGGGTGSFCLLAIQGQTITKGAVNKFSTNTTTMTAIFTVPDGDSVFTVYRHLDVMRYVRHSMNFQFEKTLTVYPDEALAVGMFTPTSFRYWKVSFSSSDTYFGCSSMFLGKAFSFTENCFNTQLTLRESDLSSVRFSPTGRRFIDEQSSRIKTLNLSLSSMNKTEASQWRDFWNAVALRKSFFLSVDETYTVLNEPMILAGKFMFNESMEMSQQTFGLWEASFSMTEVM